MPHRRASDSSSSTHAHEPNPDCADTNHRRLQNLRVNSRHRSAEHAISAQDLTGRPIVIERAVGTRAVVAADTSSIPANTNPPVVFWFRREFSLRLSRACLGKRSHFMCTWQETESLALPKRKEKAV